ncbi:Retrovirus-related Pol polyprotein LINE-1 [Gossypium australe]|uniref:Retrovirus-related Pol polyprotein LINE-1 n=1 Tax=Gossypium australe TaxID=47621 RepID=A0A5B6VQ42_9ROSI|nr:Retrovirus-related Pol polyprotein LINE-1 [Gossypium australe]
MGYGWIRFVMAFNSSINKTFLVLIPKIKSPDSLFHYRPISHHNILYKIVTKVIANLFKPIFHSFIAQNQVSFVAERQITDNILIAQEIVHSMRTKKGKKSKMAIKLDLEKAYDKICWDFIEDTLVDFGFPSTLIVLNESFSNDFLPKRGIRQDDLFLFAEADVDQAHRNKDALNTIGMTFWTQSQWNTFKFVVDKVKCKLDNWNANMLSMAGRVTLVRSVLLLIPNYIMQTMKSSYGICTKIKKIARGFVWGSSDSNNKISLVNWGRIVSNLCLMEIS